jgi:hypothetical protein
MQVITNANMMDVIQGKPIPEFKPPVADVQPAAEVKVDAAPAAQTKVEVKPETPPRGEDGKFVKSEQKADEGVKPEAAAEQKVDAEDDVVLTKKIERLINKKHRAMKEAEEFGAGEARRAIAAEQKADALQRQIDELKGTKSVGQPTAGDRAGDEPKPEDFKTVGEYTRALVKYEAKQAGEKGQQHAEQSRQQAEANQLIAGFVERQEAFKKATPDYEDVIGEADFEIPNLAQQYLVESDVGPQLAYHLAKNPDVAASLRKLSPRRLLAELGKLEVKLEAPAAAAKPAPTAATNGISKAPAPIQPLEAKTTPVTKDPKDMSFAELRAHRDAERRAKTR